VNLPIRVRLTVWYAVLLASIVFVLGAFLVLRLRSDLRLAIDREIRGAATPIALGYREGGTEDFLDESKAALPRAGAGSQILDARGRVKVGYGEGARARALVAPAVRAAALRGAPRLVTSTVESDRRFRALVWRVPGVRRPRLLVVAQSLHSVEESVRRVLVLLLLAGPAALVGTALVGWWLARKALVPVERMTSKADRIGIDRLDERVPVPRARDEVGHLAVTLNAMLDRLEQGVAEKHQLVADASHELRTPLTVMRAELDVSLRDDTLPPAAREVLESLREEVGRLSRTADNLLVLAHVDEGRLALLPSPVVVRDAIEAAVDALRPLAEAKGVRVAVDDGDRHEVRADPHRLHQVLTNFIDNAISFVSPEGEVRVAEWGRDGEVGVTVTDDGPGIPAADLPHVFDRFYRVDRSRGRVGGGSGLGLAICSEIARAHGGRVWVESVEGRGSAFSIALPAGHRDDRHGVQDTRWSALPTGAPPP